MTLRLHNTLSRRKDDLESLPGFDRNNVRMYVCGPTVYDFAHIGNARPVIVFDVLFRLLRHLYGPEHVTYVRNVTDVDDKINARAAKVAEEKGISVEAARAEITAGTSKQFDEDVAALGCLLPTHTPRATEYIRQMTAMIEQLIAAGHAYEAEGHVLFDVASKPDYGKLARRSLDEMMAGARVEVAPYKKNPMDFVLWKPSDETTPGWDSPWGRGRPGWHIECSAMGEALLGETFDIHGGGVDLTFPHHENEIAQSECAHGGHALARVWMHNGFLQVEGEKMAKSLGNFVTIRDLLRFWNGFAWSGQVIRLAMLRTHYRQPINWTGEIVLQSRDAVAHWTRVIATKTRKSSFVLSEHPPSDEIISALSDDLNTPEVFRLLSDKGKRAATGGEELALSLRADLEFLGIIDAKKLSAYGQPIEILGSVPPGRMTELALIGDNLRVAFLNNDNEYMQLLLDKLKQGGVIGSVLGAGKVSLDLRGQEKQANEYSVEQMIDARNAARKAKDFKKADEIRDELLAKGIVLKDGPTGTTWEVKR